MLNNKHILRIGFLVSFFFNVAYAGEVKIIATDFLQVGDSWSVNVTLKHDDTGWDHYTNNWRVVDAKGNVLGDRVLYHPHVMNSLLLEV